MFNKEKKPFLNLCDMDVHADFLNGLENDLEAIEQSIVQLEDVTYRSLRIRRIVKKLYKEKSALENAIRVEINWRQGE